MNIMTPEQIELARHALGLTGKCRTSYRNHFVAGAGHTDYENWMQMVAGSFATRRDGRHLPFGGNDIFHLTPDGANAALQSGERLDRDDFPPPLEPVSVQEVISRFSCTPMVIDALPAHDAPHIAARTIHESIGRLGSRSTVFLVLRALERAGIAQSILVSERGASRTRLYRRAFEKLEST